MKRLVFALLLAAAYEMLPAQEIIGVQAGHKQAGLATVESIAISDNSVYSSGTTGDILIINAKTGFAQKVLTRTGAGLESYYGPGIFIPEESLFYSSDLVEWSLPDGKESSRAAKTDTAARKLALSQDRTLLAGLADRYYNDSTDKIIVFDRKAHERLPDIRYAGKLLALEFSAFDNELVGLDEFGRVLFWNVRNGVLKRSFSTKPRMLPDYLSLALSPAGGYILIAEESVETGARLQLFEHQTGKLKYQWFDGSFPRRCSFSADGSRIAYTSDSGLLVRRIGDGAADRKLSSTILSPNTVIFSPDQKKILAADIILGLSELVDLDSEKKTMIHSHLEFVEATDIHGNYMASLDRALSGRCAVQVIDIAGHIPIWRRGIRAQIQFKSDTPEDYQVIRFSPDESMLAFPAAYASSEGDSNYVAVLNAKTGEVLYALGGFPGAVTDILFSHQSRYLFTSCTDGFLRVWDMTDGRLSATIFCRNGIKKIHFDPAANRILAIVGDNEGKNELVAVNLDAGTASPGKEINIFHNIYNNRTTGFSTDGKILAICAGDWVELYSAEDGAYTSFKSNNPLSLCFVPGQSRIALGVGSGVEIWDIAKKSRERQLPDPVIGEKISFGDTLILEQLCIAVSPDLSYMVAGSNNASAAIWDLRNITAVEERPYMADATALYPQPAAGEVFVPLDGNEGDILYIRIIASTGEAVIREQITVLPGGRGVAKIGTGTIVPGFYIISVQGRTVHNYPCVISR